MYKRKLIHKVKPRVDQIERANQMADALGELNNSITKGEGNVYAFLAEILVAEAINAIHKNTFDYDLLLPLKKGNISIDVKAKTCNSTPQPYYECSVADYNLDQKCDYYVFVRILENFESAWILGKIKKKDFFLKSTKRKVGQMDPNVKSDRQNHKFHADCHNLAISLLEPIKYRIA